MKPLKLATVKQRVGEIKRLKKDPETAHMREKDLWQDVLTEIANQEAVTESRELAREALKTLDIRFNRWFA